MARQPPCVVRPQTLCADEGLPETTTESRPRLGHVSVRFSVLFQSAMIASATVLHINALRLLHGPDIMLPFGRMLGGVPVARLTGSDEVRFSAAVDFNPQIHSPAGESSVHGNRCVRPKERRLCYNCAILLTFHEILKRSWSFVSKDIRP